MSAMPYFTDEKIQAPGLVQVSSLKTYGRLPPASIFLPCL